jgi:hypothetical protein
MEEFINKCIFFEILYYKDNFQEINNLESVNVSDWDYVKTNMTNTIYICTGIENDYLIVKSKKTTLRIKPNLIKGYLPFPKFIWNEKVIQKSKPEIEAIIDDFIWHQNHQQYYYHIYVNGKRKSKRYTENDLIKVT